MAQARTLLLVDDDVDMREALADQLRMQEDIDSIGATTGKEAMEVIASQQRFDGVLLDVGLPDADGRDLCRDMRKAGVTVPIIMLTGVEGEADTILGLDSGANDYVTKPFHFGVLMARLRAHLRQHEQSEDAVFQIGPYSFQPSLKLLLESKSGRKVRLTEKEAGILKFLYRAGQTPTPRDTLLHEVWGYNPGVTTHTLETHIYRLRQKIEDDPSNSRILITESGGYRLST